MSGKGSTLMIVLITCAVIFLLGTMTFLSFMGTYNSLVNKDVSVENSWAKVQTAYERRADLIPNLVETVKGVTKFEQETQTQIAMFRSGIKKAQTPQELDKVDAQMTSFLSGIMVSVEAYPTLKSSENFMALQDELAGTENRIKWERDNYNDAVASYKVSVRSFPTNLVANIFGFRADKWDVFEASPGSEEAPKVKF